MSSIEERIKDILIQGLCLDSTEIMPTSSLREDLGADSLDVIELAVCLEDAFSIAPFTDAEGDSMKTFGDVVRVTEKKIAQREKEVK